jgi:hypothetical protein
MYFVALDRLVCQLPMRSDTKDSKARQRRSKMIRLISLAAVFLSLSSGVLRAAVESQLSISAGGAPTSVQLLTGGVVVLVLGTDPSNLDASTTGTNINANGTIGPWTVDLAGDVGTYPKLLTLDGVLTSATAGTLDIYYTSTGFINAPSDFLLSLIGTSTAPGYTVAYDAFVDPTNSLPSADLLGLVTDSGSSCSSSVPCVINQSSTVVSPISSTDVFSLTIHIVVTHTGAGTTTFTDPAISAVPEPTSLALLGTVIAFAGIRRARRWHSGNRGIRG